MLSAVLAIALTAGAPAPKVYVILWFDTEDYLLPADDDASLWLAEYLTKQGIRATFKVVGEKARVLAERKRGDVIAALKRHEIGYHSDYHSVHPTPAQFLSNLGWDEGVAEFQRREGGGWKDVEKVFGQKPSCYGQPGSSWGPQSYGALAKWDMVYLDAGSHVSLDGLPCYYAGVFNLYRLNQYMRADLNKPDELEKSKERFAEGRRQLLKEGGGVVSIVYHPCEWVHEKFWDGVNFAKGANPPRERWVKPPQSTPEQTKGRQKVFRDYVEFMKRFDDVEFITASQAAKLYADRVREKVWTPQELRKVAAKVADGVTYQVHGDVALSASEVFALLNGYVGGTKGSRVTTTPLGPTSLVAEQDKAVTADGSQFRRTAEDVEDYLKAHGRLPGTVWLGSTGVPPEAYLRALAKVALELLDGRRVPKEVVIEPAKLDAAKYVSADDPKLWGWVIFPPGFRAPALMELARRQAWTLKPAILKR